MGKQIKKARTVVLRCGCKFIRDGKKEEWLRVCSKHSK